MTVKSPRSKAYEAIDFPPRCIEILLGGINNPEKTIGKYARVFRQWIDIKYGIQVVSCLALKNGLITRLNISKVGAFLMLLGNEFHILGRNRIVNGSHSLINNFKVNLNGRKVYDLNDANHCVNIKNLLEYGPSYANTTATNEFFFLDTNRHAEEGPAVAEYNKGFAVRKALLGASATVNTEIPLNRYSFFRSIT